MSAVPEVLRAGRWRAGSFRPGTRLPGTVRDGARVVGRPPRRGSVAGRAGASARGAVLGRRCRGAGRCDDTEPGEQARGQDGTADQRLRTYTERAIPARRTIADSTTKIRYQQGSAKDRDRTRPCSSPGNLVRPHLQRPTCSAGVRWRPLVAGPRWTLVPVFLAAMDRAVHAPERIDSEGRAAMVVGAAGRAAGCRGVTAASPTPVGAANPVRPADPDGSGRPTSGRLIGLSSRPALAPHG